MPVWTCLSIPDRFNYYIKQPKLRSNFNDPVSGGIFMPLGIASCLLLMGSEQPVDEFRQSFPVVEIRIVVNEVIRLDAPIHIVEGTVLDEG